MFDFGKDRKGNVAIVFALSLVPTLGMVGAAVDYGRASSAHAFLRAVGDQAALSIASSDENRAAETLAAARLKIENRLGPDLRRLDVTGSWLDDRHYAVRIEASIRTVMVQVVPSMPQEMLTSVETVTRRIPPTFRTLPPRRTLLEPEAADYNRISMYCFNPERRHEADGGRRAIVAIADNGSPPTDYAARPGFALPVCGPGEVVSYMLRNVRGARAHPSRWDDPRQEVYEYYADTTVDPNTQRMTQTVRGFRVFNGVTRQPLDMVASPILETILCRTDAECRPVSQGGIIPNRQTNRSPQTATGACRPGMFMYFGWEDRPPGLGWTDRDYDDIRLVVSCPEPELATDKLVTIVR